MTFPHPSRTLIFWVKLQVIAIGDRKVVIYNKHITYLNLYIESYRYINESWLAIPFLVADPNCSPPFHQNWWRSLASNWWLPNWAWRKRRWAYHPPGSFVCFIANVVELRWSCGQCCCVNSTSYKNGGAEKRLQIISNGSQILSFPGRRSRPKSRWRK